MRSYRFTTIDVFTNRRFGGNPLAVVTDAAGLSGDEMQAIAQEFNLSETTFVLPPADPAHDAQVRIFTPVTELDFAGHPNVGTALVLGARTKPSRMTFEERAGLVEIALEWLGSPTATVTAPQILTLGPDVPTEVVARCAGLSVEDFVSTRHAPCIAGMGTQFVIAEVTSAGLARAVPDLAAMRVAAAGYPIQPLGFPLHLYVNEGAVVRTRMFSPLSGIPEDPATGSANVTLCALLLACSELPSHRLTIHQGVEMGRPSLLLGHAWRGAGGVHASIGGGGIVMMDGTLTV